MAKQREWLWPYREITRYPRGVKENQHSSQTHNDQPRFTGAVEIARRCAIVLLRIESGLLCLIALYLATSAVMKKVEAPSALVGEIAFSLIGAIGLYFASRGFQQARSYGRAPALLANLIALGVSYFMISGSLIAVGAPLALLATLTAISSLLGYSE
ncbi:MAG: hypothetical protein RL414_620 [Actinomycetota bacterium]|jgi:hypothetical protein